jgi:hypothetical protein
MTRQDSMRFLARRNCAYFYIRSAGICLSCCMRFSVVHGECRGKWHPNKTDQDESEQLTHEVNISHLMIDSTILELRIAKQYQ